MINIQQLHANCLIQRKALDQTKAMLPRVKKQIEEALAKLQQQLVSDTLVSYLSLLIY